PQLTPLLSLIQSIAIRLTRCPHIPYIYFLFFKPYVDHRNLHSFPTRRSSDLLRRHHGRVRAGSEGGRHPSADRGDHDRAGRYHEDRKSTRLNSSHQIISYAVFCLKKKKKTKSKTLNE